MTMDLLAWITVPACLASHLAKEHQETPKCIACVMDVFPSLICNTSSLPPSPRPRRDDQFLFCLVAGPLKQGA